MKRRVTGLGALRNTKASLGLGVFLKRAPVFKEEPWRLKQQPLKQFSGLIEIRGNRQREMVYSGRERRSWAAGATTGREEKPWHSTFALEQDFKQFSHYNKAEIVALLNVH